MSEDYLYLQIASSIKRDIANGLYKPGDTLPAVRSYSEIWHCTIGTVQRAFQQLAAQGIVSTHIGKGTIVIGSIQSEPEDAMRKATLIHRSETFLLDVITSGYKPVEIESAFRIAMERWRSVSQYTEYSDQTHLRFAGSHDLVVAWMATHFQEFAPGYQLHLSFSGSVSGLLALAENKCTIAGSHILDAPSGTYNIPILKSLFPNEKLALITLAQRHLGLMVKKGNPKSIHHISDLVNSDVVFVNRHSGSGTRVFVDSELSKLGIESNSIKGYLNQKTTHSEVAAEIAQGHADAGIGLQAAAISSDLDFIPLTLERYDLVLKAATFDTDPIQKMLSWIKSQEFITLLDHFGGYESALSGNVQWT